MKLLKETNFYTFNHFLVKFWTHFGHFGHHNCQRVLLPAKNPVLPKGACINDVCSGMGQPKPDGVREVGRF